MVAKNELGRDHSPRSADRNGAAAYRLLYFRNSVLEDWELLDAGDLMTALQTASSRAPELTVELWADRKKVAVFRPVNRH